MTTPISASAVAARAAAASSPAATGSTELDPNRPIFFRRRIIAVSKGKNDIRQSAVRQGDWKLLRTYQHSDSEPYQTALYNLKDDIGEARNLATSHPDKSKALGQRLDAWEKEMEKTAVPFEASKP